MYTKAFICLKCLDAAVEIEIRFVTYYAVYNTSMSDYPAVPHRSALIISTMIGNTYCIYMHMYRTYLTSQRPIIQA